MTDIVDFDAYFHEIMEFLEEEKKPREELSEQDIAQVVAEVVIREVRYAAKYYI